MRKGLWIIPVILLITASYAGNSTSPEAGLPSSGGSAVDTGVQPYSDSPQQYGRNEDSSYFYDRLSPYGNWVDLNNYGYVWTPRHMGYRWRPYSDGHWVWTDYGWTWIANEEWGDIPFHYGRWGWDNEIGWFWLPGTVWGPAWVTWRSNNQYMGWAPLPPGVEFRVGMSFNSLSIDIPFNFWVFIQGSHFQDRNLNPYVLPFERNRTIVNYTSMHNNIYTRNNRIINEGFRQDEVRRITGRNVPIYALQDAQQPGRARVVGQQVQMFRPTIRQNEAAKPKAFLNRDQARQELAPAKVFEPRQQVPVSAQASAVQKRQAQEKSLLEKTQSQELKDMQRQRAAEQARIRDTSQKAKIQQDYQTKTAELQKQHQAEKQQLTERHKQDAQQVKQAAQPAKKEKQAPPVKKKKIN
ncbi:MAG: cell envelope integrity protein TolA [Candidatus Aminicenantales bacterium]